MISIYLFIALTLTLVQAKNDLNQGERDLSFKKDKIVRETSYGATIHGIFKEKEAQHVRHLAAEEVEFDNRGIQILDNNNQQVDNIPDNFKSNLQTLVNVIVDTQPLIFHGLNFLEGRSMETYHAYWNDGLSGYLPMFSTSLLVSDTSSGKGMASQAARGYKIGILFDVDDTFIHVFHGRDLNFKNPLSGADGADADNIPWIPSEHRQMGSENCNLKYANRDAELQRMFALSDYRRGLPVYLNGCYILDSDDGSSQGSEESDGSLGGFDDSNEYDLKSVVEDPGNKWVTFDGANYKNKLLEMFRENSHDSHNEVVSSLKVSKILAYVILTHINESDDDLKKDFVQWCMAHKDSLCVNLANIDDQDKKITIVNL